jgi:hypothetical protein
VTVHRNILESYLARTALQPDMSDKIEGCQG